MSDLSLRRSGLVCLVTGVAGGALALVLVAWPTNVDDTLLRYPFRNGLPNRAGRLRRPSPRPRGRCRRPCPLRGSGAWGRGAKRCLAARRRHRHAHRLRAARDAVRRVDQRGRQRRADGRGVRHLLHPDGGRSDPGRNRRAAREGLVGMARLDPNGDRRRPVCNAHPRHVRRLRRRPPRNRRVDADVRSAGGWSLYAESMDRVRTRFGTQAVAAG